tara:strand:- start:2160 stop:2264 length:105 start_codon:yes stop_codon:yes gene_type:complete
MLNVLLGIFIGIALRSNWELIKSAAKIIIAKIKK